MIRKLRNSNRIKFFIILLIAAVAFIASFIIVGFYNNKKTKTLGIEFKNVGYLVTQEARITKIINASEDRNIFNIISIPFTTSYLVFTIDVGVEAGIEFKEIEYQFKDNYNIIKVKLPKAKIQNYYEVPKTFETIIDEENIFNNIPHTETAKMKDQLIEEAKKEAIENGILDRAEENAKQIIEALIRKQFNDIKIEWK